MSLREEFVAYLKSMPDSEFRLKEGDKLPARSDRRSSNCSSSRYRARCRKAYQRRKAGEIRAIRAAVRAKKSGTGW
jgi:hypothetical protein